MLDSDRLMPELLAERNGTRLTPTPPTNARTLLLAWAGAERRETRHAQTRADFRDTIAFRMPPSRNEHNKNDRADKEEEEDAVAIVRRQLLRAMFYVRQQGEEDNQREASAIATNKNASSSSSSPAHGTSPFHVSSRKSPLANSEDGSTSTEEGQDRAAARMDGVLNQIDKQIPQDPTALRQTSLYKGALQMLQWQRDNYLVGKEYADWRKNDRKRSQQQRQNQEQANDAGFRSFRTVGALSNGRRTDLTGIRQDWNEVWDSVYPLIANP